MKKIAILPAFLLLLAGASSCEKNQDAPAPATPTAADSALNSLTQGKTVTSQVPGTYQYQKKDAQGNLVYDAQGNPVYETGTFTSYLSISRFEVQSGVITAIGTLSATNTSGPSANYGPVAVQIPLALSQISSSCSGATVNYGTQTVIINGQNKAVNPVLSVSPSQSNKNLLGNLVCSLGVILGNPSAKDTGGVVAHLNKIISVIGQ